MSTLSKKQNLITTWAITGNIGSGKSTVAQQLSEFYPLISTDQLTAEILATDETVKKQLVELFSLTILTADQQIDKQKLAALIFHDLNAKQQLEQLLHPLIEQKMYEQLAQLKQPLCFIEVPLLFEANWQAKFDHCLLVYTHVDILIKRFAQLPYAKSQAYQKRLTSQIADINKLALVDYIIYNNGTLNELDWSVKQFRRRLEGK